MKIQVTQEDICQGRKGDVSACPVALAIKRQAHVEFAQVGPFDVLTPLSPGYVDLPQQARDFIAHYDRDKEVAPFEFELPL